MKKRKNKLVQHLDQPIVYGIIIFILVSLLVFWLNQVTETEWSDFVTELNGVMFDILIFGVLIVWLNKRSEESRIIRNYHEQLEDFRFWKGEEGVNRKVGLFKRFLAAGQSIPSLHRMELEGAYLKDFELSGTTLRHANLATAFLLDANLSDADLEFANIEKAYLQGANLTGACLRQSYAGHVDFRSTNLNRVDAVCANFEGCIFWNASLVKADLEGANLDRADFTKADLSEAHLVRTRFGTANLNKATLDKADLRGSDVSCVEGLTFDQVSTAWIDEETELPPDLQGDMQKLLDAQGTPPPLKTGFEKRPPAYRSKPSPGDYVHSQQMT